MSELALSYHSRFGLEKHAFGMAPDPEMLYLTPGHREALAGLTYAISGKKGLTVLTGEVGTGKTTLLARALRHLPKERIKASVIVNPRLTTAEFLEMALIGWGISNPPESKSQRLYLFYRMLSALDKCGKSMMLIVDEAHALSTEVLEEIRLLGNHENYDQQLLQIVLVGQSELNDLLNREDLRQVRQRIAVRLNIGRLSTEEVREYMEYRWKRAGGGDLPFSAEAIAEIGRFSQGIPRLINAICDNALVLTAAGEPTPIGSRAIHDVCRDLGISAPPAHAAVASAIRGKQQSEAQPAPRPSEPEYSEYPLKCLQRYAPANHKPLLLRLAERFTA